MSWRTYEKLAAPVKHKLQENMRKKENATRHRPTFLSKIFNSANLLIVSFEAKAAVRKLTRFQVDVFLPITNEQDIMQGAQQVIQVHASSVGGVRERAYVTPTSYTTSRRACW